MSRSGLKNAILAVVLIAVIFFANGLLQARYGFYTDQDIRYFSRHCRAVRNVEKLEEHVLASTIIFGFLGGVEYIYDEVPGGRIGQTLGLGWQRTISFLCFPLIGCLNPPELGQDCKQT